MSINNFTLYEENEKKRKGKNIKKLSQRRNLRLNVFFMSFWVPDISLRRLYNPCVALTFSRVFLSSASYKMRNRARHETCSIFPCYSENGMGTGKL